MLEYYSCIVTFCFVMFHKVFQPFRNQLCVKSYATLADLPETKQNTAKVQIFIGFACFFSHLMSKTKELHSCLQYLNPKFTLRASVAGAEEGLCGDIFEHCDQCFRGQ